MNESNILLEVKHLKKWFPVRRGLFRKPTSFVKAVDDVNLTVKAGETLGIVGESGCGKSTLARTILRLLEPTSGEILFSGENFTELSSRKTREMRKYMQIIFQDPYASLNPRQRIRDMLIEPFKIHNIAVDRKTYKKAEELLEMVGLSPDSMQKFPHEFSGGQRQRLCIARALSVDPKLIICDECVSALDVSVQAQIINLLINLQHELGLTLVFISHDIRVIRHISTHVAVMYLGHVVEYAPTEELFCNPQHPYTKALLSAVPVPDPNIKTERIILSGEIPSPINIPKGCPFHPRCFAAKEDCCICMPKSIQVCPGHSCVCLHPEVKQNEIR